MKFYETTFDEYLQQVNNWNLHPELQLLNNALPSTIEHFPNLIFYGPSGVGKYSQMIHFIAKYSPSQLKYETKQHAIFNKQTYIYHISDIHYEIDMAILGCNSKLLWHEIFTQIYEMVQVKSHKVGIIVCKNMHAIHSELLDIFYAYMQEHNSYYKAGTSPNVLIKFILITESVSFLPINITNTCKLITCRRPTPHQYQQLVSHKSAKNEKGDEDDEEEKEKEKDGTCIKMVPDNIKSFLHEPLFRKDCMAPNLPNPNPTEKVCTEIIHQIQEYKRLNISSFREAIYDIFTYNLNVSKCVWFIIEHLAMVRSDKGNQGEWENDVDVLLLDMDRDRDQAMINIVIKTFSFFKYFNNNYRPIYHLEDLFIYMILQLYGNAPNAPTIPDQIMS